MKKGKLFDNYAAQATKELIEQVVKGLKFMSQLSDLLKKNAIASKDARVIQEIRGMFSQEISDLNSAFFNGVVPDYAKPYLNVLEESIKQLDEALAEMKQKKTKK